MIFLEDYDIGLARKLKQGVDVWLNNPIRPLEASGTSGMKVAANGGLNLSILDGWWLEGCDGKNGWAIGSVDKTYPNQELQDQLDNESLLNLLEEEVVPLYFDRDARGLPEGWLARMRHALETLPVFFDTNRMVGQYAQEAYAPLAQAHRELTGNSFARLDEEANHRRQLLGRFETVRIVEVRVPDLSSLRSGESIAVEVELDLAGLEPDSIDVEFLAGHAGDHDRSLQGATLQRLAPTGPGNAGGMVYRTTREIEASGSYRFGVRVRPHRRGPWDADLAGRTIWA